MQRILNRSFGDVTLDGSGNGSFAIPATTSGSMPLLYLCPTSGLSCSTTDGPLSEQGFTMGPSSTNTRVYFRTNASSGITAIALSGGTPSASIGMVYLEYAGINSLNGSSLSPVWDGSGTWTSRAQSPTSNGWTGLLIGAVFGSTAGAVLTGTSGYTTQIQFTTATSIVIGIEDQEILAVDFVAYTASGIANPAGGCGGLMIFRANLTIQQTLWARSSI